MPANAESTAVLPSLSPICGRPGGARFDAALMSSDGGLLVLRAIERRLGIARRLAACETQVSRVGVSWGLASPRLPARLRRVLSLHGWLHGPPPDLRERGLWARHRDLR